MMVHPCDKPCGNKSASGYCATTACINPQYSNIGTVQYGQGVQKRIITNADKIRAMSDEELAEFVSGVEAEAIRRAGLFITTGDIKRGKDGWLDWLKQEGE